MNDRYLVILELDGSFARVQRCADMVKKNMVINDWTHDLETSEWARTNAKIITVELSHTQEFRFDRVITGDPKQQTFKFRKNGWTV